ncbi:unnamed protein product [Closterium sp. NIES-53]
MAATTTSLRLAPACATLRADPAHSLKGATTVKAVPKRQRAGAARAAMMEAPPVPMKSHEEKNLPHIEQIKALSLVTAIKTPYLPDGRFDIDAYDYLVHHQIENGTEAIIVGGTTGEGHLMSWDEHVMLIAHTVNCFGDQIKVIGNTGSNSTGEAMHATEQGFAVGMHAALQINPYYGKTSVDGIIQHYKAVLPMGPAIIYNVPGRTGTDLTPDVIEELAQHENFAGVKECVGNDRVSAHTSKGIVVWSGNDDQCHDAKWKHGANGVISVLSNLVPGTCSPEIGRDSKSLPIVSPKSLPDIPILRNRVLARAVLARPLSLSHNHASSHRVAYRPRPRSSPTVFHAAPLHLPYSFRLYLFSPAKPHAAPLFPHPPPPPSPALPPCSFPLPLPAAPYGTLSSPLLPLSVVPPCSVPTHSPSPPPALASAPRALLQPARRALLRPARRALPPCASRSAALRVAPCCPARRALLQPTGRALLQPVRSDLLPHTLRPAALHSARPAALSTARPVLQPPAQSARGELPNSTSGTSSTSSTPSRTSSARPAALSTTRPVLRAPCPAALSNRAAPPSPSGPAQPEPRRPTLITSPTEQRCPARAAPPSPSRPPATTAAAGGGAAGSDGSADGDGGVEGATRSAGGAASAARATGSAGGAAGAGAARGGQRRSLPLPDDPTPQQLREWVLQRARPGGGGFGFLRTAQRRQQSQQETFSPQMLSELFPQRCVTRSVEAATLGASESAAALGASKPAAVLGASEFAAALGARASPATGPSLAEALHTFTLDSDASRCFFRDCTTLTPLTALVPVSLADPTGGPVVARVSTVLPCPAVPSDSLSSLHLPTISTVLVTNTAIQDVCVDTFIPGGQRMAICQVAASSRVSVSGQLATSCSCQVLSHHTLLRHHRLVHPSLPCLHGMHSCLLVSGLPRSLPSFPRSPALPCLPYVEGRQRAAPHSSEFPPTTAPLQTLHMDVWGPVSVSGTDQERYFLLVVDDYTRYTTVFPLRRKANVSSGIIQTFTLPASPQQNGIAVHRIGLIMERPCPHSGGQGRLAMRQCFGSGARSPLFAMPKRASSPLALSAASSLASPPTPRHGTFTSCARVESSPLRTSPLTSLTGPAPSGVSQVDPPPLVEPLEISSDSSGPAEGDDPAADDTAATRRSPRLETPPGFSPRPSSPPPQPAAVDYGAETAGAEPGGAETEGKGSGGAATGSDATGDTGSGGAATGGADSGGPASPSGSGAVGDPAEGPGAGQPPQPDLREMFLRRAIHAWIVRQGSPGGGVYGPTGAAAASPGGTTGAGGTGGTAGGAGGAAGAGGTRGAGGGGGAGATSPRGATGAGGAGPTSPGGTAGARGAGAAGLGGAAGAAGAASAGGVGAAGTALRRPFFYPQPLSASTHVHARRVARPRPLAVPGTHGMSLRLSSVPQRVVLPEPPASSLLHVLDPESNLACAASPTVTRLLASVITDPDLESTAAFALITELVDFAARSHLDYVASLVTESESVCPPSVGGELALGNPDALDIPTLRSYAEAIVGGYSSQWQIAMDTEMASWKSIGTYVDEVPPPGANIVDGMWIFRVKRPPSSPPAFKARYVARGFMYVDDQVLQRFGFQFSSPQPTPVSTGHSLSAPPSDESVEPSGSYPELVGCLVYLMTCTRPDLAYPLSLLARYVAPGRHRKVHGDAAKSVVHYWCSTSGMELVLGGQGSVVLIGYSDASWANDQVTQRSSHGHTFSLGSGSVS